MFAPQERSSHKVDKENYETNIRIKYFTQWLL